MPRAPSTTSPWPRALRDRYAIHNVIAQRPELPFFLVHWDGAETLRWMDLGDPRQRLQPFHFEIYFAKKGVRDAHYHRTLAEARRAGDVVVRDLFGFSDLFCPVAGPDAPPGASLLVVYAGQFYRRQPDWETLGAQWQALTGQTAASGNPDFARFVRMALALPVLEPPLLAAIEEFARLVAEDAGGAPGADLDRRLAHLNGTRISRLWPIEDWVESAISPNKFQLTPWHLHGELTDWMREGMGIDRLPTTAMALMPVDARDAPLDPMQTLVRNAHVQRACIELARELPETAATRLQDYGVSILTSTASGKSASRARGELRERAQRFREHVRARLGVHVVVGIGSTLAPGSPLHPSHREAVLAMHRAMEQRRPVLCCDENGAGQPLRYAELHAAARALLEAMERESSTEIEAATDHYVRLVLRFSAERVEVVRSHFLAVLFQLLGAARSTCPMSAEARERLEHDLARRLEDACSLYQLLEGFHEALGRLSVLASRAWDGPSAMRIEATLLYLRESYARHLPLPAVARRAGFSVPAFVRAFRQATGTSFLVYLRALRVERAKHLLETTNLDGERIAVACGFQSAHHLLRSFKKVTHLTPGAYRRAHRRFQTKEDDDVAMASGEPS